MKNCSNVVVSVRVVIFAAVSVGMAFEFARGHMFVALQCLITLFLCSIPLILNRRFEVGFPGAFEITAILFFFASTYLGEIRGFYKQLPLWDTMLHITSGFLTAAIGFSIIEFHNRNDSDYSLTPGFVTFFAFCFSMTTGVVWEFYEFGMDMIFSTDMQKDSFVGKLTSMLIDKEHLPIESAVINGEVLPGWLDIGLIDTMKDLIANASGAVIFWILALNYMKNLQPNWIAFYILKTKCLQNNSLNNQ